MSDFAGEEEEEEEEEEEDTVEVPEELKELYDELVENSKAELLLFAYKEGIKVDRELSKEELLDSIFKSIVDTHNEKEEQEEFIEEEDKEIMEKVGTSDDDSFDKEEELLATAPFPEDSEVEQELTESASVATSPASSENLMVDKYSGDEFKEQVSMFIELMSTTNPDMIYPNNSKVVSKACRTIARIVYKHNIDRDELFEALTWAIQDDFWKHQIITLSGLKNVSKRNSLAKWQNIMNAYRSYVATTKKESGVEPTVKENDSIRKVSL